MCVSIGAVLCLRLRTSIENPMNIQIKTQKGPMSSHRASQHVFSVPFHSKFLALSDGGVEGNLPTSSLTGPLPRVLRRDVPQGRFFYLVVVVVLVVVLLQGRVHHRSRSEQPSDPKVHGRVTGSGLHYHSGDRCRGTRRQTVELSIRCRHS